MDTFLYSIYNYLASHKTLRFIGLLCLTLSLSALTINIEFEEDITKLIPTNSKNKNFKKVLKTTNFSDKIIIKISKKPQGTVDDLTQYASKFIDHISTQSKTYIKAIQGKVDDTDVLQTLDFVYNNLPLFLENEDYETIKHKIQKDSLTKLTLTNYKTLISPTGLIAKKTILKDPLGLSFIALKKLQRFSFGENFTLHNGFLLSKNKQHLLLFITPTLAASETSENAKFVNQLYHINSTLNTRFKNKVEGSYFGSTFIAVANAKQIKKDIQLTIGIALSILLLIFIVFYKKISIPLILFIPTIFGGALAVCILYLIRTKISAISLGIGSILLGVTLDYSLHILTHIKAGNTIKSLYKEISKPILISSLTTALAFLCLLFLNSTALQDLGVFAAVSVLGASCFALIFIPQVYKKQDLKTPKHSIIDKLAGVELHKNKWSIISLILFLFISCFTYKNVSFNNDLSTLNFEPQHLKNTQNQLDKLTNSVSKSIYVSTYGPTEELAIQANDSVFKLLKKLKAEHNIVSFNSMGFLIQSKTQQEQKIKKWKAFWNPETIKNTKTGLIKSGLTLGFKPKTFQPFYNLLNKTFTPLKSIDFKNIKTFSVSDFITTKSHFTTVTTLVKINNNTNKAVISKLKNVPKTIVIDRKEMNETFLGNLKIDFNRLIGYSFIVVFIILFVFYKSLHLTIVTCIPICLTWLITVGVMGCFKIEFNIFNIIISTFIFGLGIDYSIFITNGLLSELKTGKKALKAHKTSIILSVITTLLGVGVLIFAKHPALYSISLVSIIGIVSAVLMAFTFQPLLFIFFIGNTTNRPVPFKYLIHSIISFLYFGLGGLVLSLFSVTILKILPVSKKTKMSGFHFVVSKFMKSVLKSFPFLKTKINNPHHETFKKQSIIIANHNSFLDILAIGMLHPKIIFLVNDWVYHSPIFGKAVQLAGFYPVSNGIENGLSHLEKKVKQGYSLMVFPEGTRSKTNKIQRFHKGAFYLATHFKLDILPVLIHGNSEILPKGHFIIRKGNITLKILNRINPNDTRFGTTYSKKTKLISRYFKDEFKKLRLEKETKSYFNTTILDVYKYKNKSIYNIIKTDLKTFGDTYKIILNTINNKETIIHFSNDYGQLAFLLNLDETERTLFVFVKNNKQKQLITTSFITKRFKKITCLENLEKTLLIKANAAIISIKLNEKILKALQASTIILIKEARLAHEDLVDNVAYNVFYKNENLIILKKM